MNGQPPAGPIDFCAPDKMNGASRRADASSADDRHAAPIALLDCPAIAQPLPGLEYVVRDIGLVAGGGAPHLIAGYGFSGKTVAAQSLGLSLAADVPVWGAHKAQPR